MEQVIHMPNIPPAAESSVKALEETSRITWHLSECKKPMPWKTQHSVASGNGEVIQGKPGVDSNACAAGHYRWENTGWLTHWRG